MKRLMVAIFALALVGTSSAGEWHIETVDSEGTVGRDTSLALDSDDHPHISYYDSYYNNDLKYAHWTESAWQIETVDSEGRVGEDTSLALDSSGYPHISYYDYTNTALKYARWNGSSWQIQTVDSAGHVGRYTSLALDSSDNPHISYLDNPNHDLKYARWDGDEWHIETVDSTGHVGGHTSLALDASDNPHISYYESHDCDLKYARWDGDEWQIETVDSENAGWYTSLALDSSGYPHISYQKVSSVLKYARWDGAAWQIEIVDSVGRGYTSLALDSSDHPHISYYGYGHLKYARWNGSSWHLWVVDPESWVGSYTSVALDASGSPHISYHGSSPSNLKYAYWDGEPGVEGAELYANINDESVLVGWEITVDAPAAIRVLRSVGKGEPVDVSGSLSGAAVRWLDRDAYEASDKGLKPLVYRLEVTEEDGTVTRFGPTEAVTIPEPTRGLSLSVYPSPAADALTVSFALPSEGRVTVALYDLSGRRVATVVDSDLTAGRHDVSCDVSTLTPGVYLARLETGTGTLTRRVVVAR